MNRREFMSFMGKAAVITAVPAPVLAYAERTISTTNIQSFNFLVQTFDWGTQTGVALIDGQFAHAVRFVSRGMGSEEIEEMVRKAKQMLVAYYIERGGVNIPPNNKKKNIPCVVCKDV